MLNLLDLKNETFPSFPATMSYLLLLSARLLVFLTCRGRKAVDSLCVLSRQYQWSPQCLAQHGGDHWSWSVQILLLLWLLQAWHLTLFWTVAALCHNLTHLVSSSLSSSSSSSSFPPPPKVKPGKQIISVTELQKLRKVARKHFEPEK